MGKDERILRLCELGLFINGLDRIQETEFSSREWLVGWEPVFSLLIGYS